VNNALLSEKVDRKLVLSLALMWIFRKRAFSVTKEFGLFLVEVKEERPYGQVDLEARALHTTKSLNQKSMILSSPHNTLE